MKFSFDGYNFENQASTTYDHYAQALGNYRTKPFVMGRSWTKTHYNHGQTEIYDWNTSQWIISSVCPYYLSYDTIVSSRDSVFILGGWSGGLYQQNIYRFKDDIWTDHGNLMNAVNSRIKTVTFDSQHIILVGGEGIEIWDENFVENRFWKQNSTLVTGHAIFLVENNFCQAEDNSQSRQNLLQLGQ